MEYFTIAMGAPWFFPLIGGVMLCGEALELARCVAGKAARERREEARDEAEPLARARALAAAAMRLVVLLCLLAWTGATTYIALTVQTLAAHLVLSRRRPCHAGFFHRHWGRAAGRGRRAAARTQSCAR